MIIIISCHLLFILVFHIQFYYNNIKPRRQWKTKKSWLFSPLRPKMGELALFSSMSYFLTAQEMLPVRNKPFHMVQSKNIQADVLSMKAFWICQGLVLVQPEIAGFGNGPLWGGTEMATYLIIVVMASLNLFWTRYLRIQFQLVPFSWRNFGAVGGWTVEIPSPNIFFQAWPKNKRFVRVLRVDADCRDTHHRRRVVVLFGGWMGAQHCQTEPVRWTMMIRGAWLL